MSIYTHNWESVMNLGNKVLNIDEKQERKIKNEKKTDKKPKNKKHVFLYHYSYTICALL